MLLRPRRLFLLLTIAAAAAILLLSLLPDPPQVLQRMVPSDKLAHAAAYLILSSLIMVQFSGRFRFFLISVASSSAYGALIEGLQYLTGRKPEGWDLAANLAGAVCGAGIVWLYQRRKQQIESRSDN